MNSQHKRFFHHHTIEAAVRLFRIKPAYNALEAQCYEALAMQPMEALALSAGLLMPCTRKNASVPLMQIPTSHKATNLFAELSREASCQ